MDLVLSSTAKVVGTATPKQPPDRWNAAWQFSTGDELMLVWQPSLSTNTAPTFRLTNQTSSYSSVKLLRVRRMQYQVDEEADDDEDGADFVTLVRYADDNPTGRATALINWKLRLVEFVPEEDAVLVLLLGISILRSVSDIRKEDVGNLLTRWRRKEAKLGERDWGSVILHLRPWHWDVKSVMASNGADTFMKQPTMSYSPSEGGDGLYHRGLIR